MGSNHTIKRIFDIICALIGMIVLIPLCIIVKIAYLLTGDTKSIFYTQDRIGKNGKIFKLYKFRTMVPNADKILEEILKEDTEQAREYKLKKKITNDPRITKAGKILRKSSLDELPQMFCILINSMTMIGNRPYLPREKEDMGEYYDDIVKTKPGLTGLWQISGRSNTTFEDRLKLEQQYSNCNGLRTDLKIFFRTFKAVFKCIGSK